MKVIGCARTRLCAVGKLIQGVYLWLRGWLLDPITYIPGYEGQHGEMCGCFVFLGLNIYESKRGTRTDPCTN